MSQSPTPGSEISALLVEDRTFPAPPAFTATAHANDPAIYQRAADAPEAFWDGFARELEWIEPWTKALEWKSPDATWFVGGKLNASVNCVDRHIRTARRNKAAIIWEGEPGDRRTLTYFDLYREVNQFAHVIKGPGMITDLEAHFMDLGDVAPTHEVLRVVHPGMRDKERRVETELLQQRGNKRPV